LTKAKEPDIKNHAYTATILRWPDTPEWLNGCCRNNRPDASECAWIEAQAKLKPSDTSQPTSKQVAFAERLARIKRRAVPDE
jgi:hypothetical protein